jgi:hypothetical protein
MNQRNNQQNIATTPMGRDVILDIVHEDAGKLLRPSEVSKVLGVAIQTLAVWRSSKRENLNYLKIGSRVFYQKSDVMNFIQSNLIVVGPNVTEGLA